MSKKKDPKQLLLFDAFEERHPTRGIGWAGRWLKMLADPNDQMGQWLKKRRDLYGNDQLVYMDRVTECYRPIFHNLPVQAAAILWNLCKFYRKGTTLSHLAYVSRIQVNALSSQLHRMVDEGIIKRLERGKYAIADIDMLRYYALRGDHRINRFDLHNGDPSNVLDRFMDFVESLPAEAA